MANTEIDSLSLDIQITGLKDEDIKGLDKLSRAVARLTKSLKDANFSKLKDIQVPKGLKNIQIITQNFKETMSGVVSDTALDDLKDDFDDLGDSVENNTQKIENSALKIGEATKKTNDSTKGMSKGLKEAEDILNGKDSKDKKKNSIFDRLGKIFKRFKTILFIKTVRAIINAVVQAVQKGIQNLALFDKSFNETISSMKTSATNITNALTLTIRPLIETLEPFVNNIANVMVQVGNSVSKLQAQTKGLSTYTKINAKYTEDYAKSLQKANLFSFDTFNSIDTQSSMFEEASVNEESSENANGVAEAFMELHNTLALVVELVDVLLKAIGKILQILSPILKKLLYIINIVLKPLIDLVDVLLSDLLNPILEICVAILEPVLDILIECLEPIVDLIKEATTILKPILEMVTSVLKIAMELNVTNMALGMGLTSIKEIVELLTDGISIFLKKFESIVQVAMDLYDIFQAIFNGDFEGFGDKWLKLLNDIGKALLNVVLTPIRLIAKVIDTIINTAISFINGIFEKIGKIFEWLGWGTNNPIEFRSDLLGKFDSSVDGWLDSFANGGIVGEVWQMNEYGVPEMLYNSNNGSTAVITQDQLARAFEQAIYNTGILDVIQSSGGLYLDGKEIAQSQSFKNELNRTNPSLNIR